MSHFIIGLYTSSPNGIHPCPIPIIPTVAYIWLVHAAETATELCLEHCRRRRVRIIQIIYFIMTRQTVCGRGCEWNRNCVRRENCNNILCHPGTVASYHTQYYVQSINVILKVLRFALHRDRPGYK